jgi:hypothetical protein
MLTWKDILKILLSGGKKRIKYFGSDSTCGFSQTVEF